MALLRRPGVAGATSWESETAMQIIEGMEVITSDGQTLGFIEYLLVADSLQIKADG